MKSLLKRRGSFYFYFARNGISPQANTIATGVCGWVVIGITALKVGTSGRTLPAVNSSNATAT